MYIEINLSMRTSYSALETYKLCPQKYQFQEIDRIRVKKSKAAVFGTHIHSALRYMFSQDPLFPTLDQVLDYSRAHWPSQETFDVSPEEKTLYVQSGERIIRNFYAKNAPWNFSVVDLESHFEVLIEDPRRHETHVLAGRIDRIDKVGDGFEVIDYKTSRTLPSQAKVDADLQMSIYALGLQRRWPHVAPESITLSLYFLKHGEKLSTARTSEANAATQEDVLRTISEIRGKQERGERFEPVPGPHCGFCPYKPQCPAWRHLYRKPEAENPTDADMQVLIQEYFDIVKNDRQAAKRLSELKEVIRSYMETQGFDRVFGDEGVLSRSVQKRYVYDVEKVRAILVPLGKWEEALALDDQKVKLIAKTLPLEIQTRIEGAKVLTKEYIVIAASMKKIPRPEGVFGTDEAVGA